MRPSNYHFELWSPDGHQLADLAGRARSRSVTQARNMAEDISCSFDLDELEAYCRSIHEDPNTLIQPGRTELRVRRGRTYLCGGLIQLATPTASADGATLDIRATGFLGLFTRRYTPMSRIYTATQSTDIAWSLINESQSQGPNWDFGVRRGNVAYTGLHDRTYADSVIRDMLVELTNVKEAPFDLEFSADKLFHTYAQLGSRRPDVVFDYPGDIAQVSSPGDASAVANHIVLYGQGTGDEVGVTATVDDFNSQTDSYVWESRITDSSVSDPDTLTSNGMTALATSAYPMVLPSFTVNGNQPPLVTDYGIGDYVTLRTRRYRVFQHLNGLYRVEQRVITIDEDDNESVALTVSR